MIGSMNLHNVVSCRVLKKDHGSFKTATFRFDMLDGSWFEVDAFSDHVLLVENDSPVVVDRTMPAELVA